jgi:hypothetical protein
VLVYVRVGKPERAKTFFEHIAPSMAPMLLQRLVALYESEGRASEAALVLGGPSR